MIAAFVTLGCKKERGVGKQNFRYAPGFKEFMLILRSHGRHVYEFAAKHIPMMEDRSILYAITLYYRCLANLHQRKFNELRIPRFPVVICSRSFDLVHDHLAKLSYAGPVGLSCDDTKLSSALQPYWDRDAGCYFILGGTGDPIRIPDVESFRELIEEAGVNKATKVCSHVLSYVRQIDVRIAPSLVFTDTIS